LVNGFQVDSTASYVCYCQQLNTPVQHSCGFFTVLYCHNLCSEINSITSLMVVWPWFSLQSLDMEMVNFLKLKSASKEKIIY